MITLFKAKIEYDLFIGIEIDRFDTLAIEKVKKIVGRRWHPLEKIWTIPYTSESYQELKKEFSDNFEISEIKEERIIKPIRAKKIKSNLPHKAEPYLFDKLNDEQKNAVSVLEHQLILERKAYSTQKNYRNHFIYFLWTHQNINPKDISHEQIKEYILKRIKEHQIAFETQNQIVSALKIYYERILNQSEKTENLFRPKKVEYLPTILTPDEISTIFKYVTNLKHRCLLMLMYGSGLRVGEVVKLKIEDVDFDEKSVFIFRSKGNKDRITILPEKAIPILKEYIAMYKPQEWLFESPEGEHYSIRSVQQIFSTALKKTGIKKRVSTHSLRHAFATHLLKSRVDLDFVREVMGHNSKLTTQRYLHVLKNETSNTKSPFNDLQF